MIFQGYGVEVGSKSQTKIDKKHQAQDGLHLSIDFWWILVGFGRQVGMQNQAKSEKKND